LFGGQMGREFDSNRAILRRVDFGANKTLIHCFLFIYLMHKFCIAFWIVPALLPISSKYKGLFCFGSSQGRVSAIIASIKTKHEQAKCINRSE
jgi:hypothetical protein